MNSARDVPPSAWACGPRYRRHVPRMRTVGWCISFKSLPVGKLYQF